MGQPASTNRQRPGSPGDDPLELPALCALPSCRTEYRRIVGPGRPQLYCSEVCRRRAEKEIRQVRSRLRHFESLVSQARTDLAAYGRPDLDDGNLADASVGPAMVAVARAAGALRFIQEGSDPVADELRHLHDAVAPFIEACSPDTNH